MVRPNTFLYKGQRAPHWAIVDACGNKFSTRSDTKCGLRRLSKRLGLHTHRKILKTKFMGISVPPDHTPKRTGIIHIPVDREGGRDVRNISTGNCLALSLTLLEIFPQAPLSARIRKQPSAGATSTHPFDDTQQLKCCCSDRHTSSYRSCP